MANAIHFWGHMCISKQAELDTAISDTVVELTGGISQQKQILIDAITDWLQNWHREFGYFDRQASKMRRPNA